MHARPTQEAKLKAKAQGLSFPGSLKDPRSQLHATRGLLHPQLYDHVILLLSAKQRFVSFENLHGAPGEFCLFLKQASIWFCFSAVRNNAVIWIPPLESAVRLSWDGS